MMESLQGEGGIRPGDKAFFQEIRKICDATGAVMIMDEVSICPFPQPYTMPFLITFGLGSDWNGSNR